MVPAKRRGVITHQVRVILCCEHYAPKESYHVKGMHFIIPYHLRLRYRSKVDPSSAPRTMQNITQQTETLITVVCATWHMSVWSGIRA
jgi:hypothetical protein